MRVAKRQHARAHVMNFPVNAAAPFQEETVQREIARRFELRNIELPKFELHGSNVIFPTSPSKRT
jgi:hypothetical protein